MGYYGSGSVVDLLVVAGGVLKLIRVPETGRSRRAEISCGFNWSMQHFILKCLRGGVDNEIQNSDFLHRRTKSSDVGTLAER
ncbi:MAG: hypothetical protein WCF09_06895, partial [Gallionella sp.]